MAPGPEETSAALAASPAVGRRRAAATGRERGRDSCPSRLRSAILPRRSPFGPSLPVWWAARPDPCCGESGTSATDRATGTPRGCGRDHPRDLARSGAEEEGWQGDGGASRETLHSAGVHGRRCRGPCKGGEGGWGWFRQAGAHCPPRAQPSGCLPNPNSNSNSNPNPNSNSNSNPNLNLNLNFRKNNLFLFFIPFASVNERKTETTFFRFRSSIDSLRGGGSKIVIYYVIPDL